MNARIAGQQFHFGMDATGRDLPEAWRDLDRAVWRWVRAHGGDRDTAHAAAWASHADGQGHSALPLLPQEEGGLPPLSAEQREAIARSPLVLDVGAASTAEAVATPPHERPFVLDGDHFYLLRNHRAEAAVAEALRARRALAHEPACPLTDDELRTLFDGKWDQAAERQRAADPAAFEATVREALQQHVRGLLAPYEYPKEVEFIDQLPMTTTGKVQRRVLRLQEEARAAQAAA